MSNVEKFLKAQSEGRLISFKLPDSGGLALSVESDAIAEGNIERLTKVARMSNGEKSTFIVPTGGSADKVVCATCGAEAKPAGPGYVRIECGCAARAEAATARLPNIKAAAIPLAREYLQGQMADRHPHHRALWEALIEALGPDAKMADEADGLVPTVLTATAADDLKPGDPVVIGPDGQARKWKP